MNSADTTLGQLRKAIPSEGLFAAKEWLLSPEPFPLSDRFREDLEMLGYRLSKFYRACNLLYRLSVKGKQPAWVADYLDRGKPRDLIEYSRERVFADELPQVIRPDIILTEHGYAITELDSVPGGIGLTAWLNETYSGFGFEPTGGATGMLKGFSEILPGGDIVISEESATYRPEMVWLADRLNNRFGGGAEPRRWEVHNAEGYQPESRNVYRFFELFDLPSLNGIGDVLKANREGAIRMTPPVKPYLEEKMLFALFWMRPLQHFWRRGLGERHWLKLREVIPYTWILDPTPVPHHGVIPRLGVHSWSELESFSQKERDLILKISGFSELAWGSRGVVLGHDLPQKVWTEKLRKAIDLFEISPYVLQEFHKGRLLEHPYFDPETGETRNMRGRVRLCPYYFFIGGKTRLCGVLVAVCPADKKLIHGMKDAILVPAGRSDL